MILYNSEKTFAKRQFSCPLFCHGSVTTYTSSLFL